MVRSAVVVLGYGTEPLLLDCLRAAGQQLDREHDALVLVDNGIPAALRRAAVGLGVHVVGDGRNTGFAGGCRLGAEATDAACLVFLNSDAVLRPNAVAILREALEQPTVGMVSGCLRLADQPDLVNSAGNPLHFLGFTWAGHCGEPANRHLRAQPVPVATGGLFAIKRETWDRLGGFDPEYFAYHEDADLSLRCWLSGSEVYFEPNAVADHHYEFSRNPQKLYLVERNRLITVLTDYPSGILRRVFPALLAIEIPLTLSAVASGWARQKMAAWWWLISRWRWLRARRRWVQSQTTVSNADVADLLTAEIAPPMVQPPPGMQLLNEIMQTYWRWVRRSLR